MRWLIWYLRCCFCAHDWEIQQATITTKREIPHGFGSRTVTRDTVWISMLCTKCAWHQKYRKFTTDD